MRVLLATISLASMALAVAIASGPQADVPKSFYEAIRTNALPQLSALIRQNGPNVADADGNTPLMIAALDGTPEAMKMLLAAGANPNDANSVKATALMWCVGTPAKVKLLLDKGADVNAVSGDKQTPLFMASSYDNSAESVRLLLQKGAKVSPPVPGGLSALEAACAINNLAATKLLIEHGADVNYQDRSHQNALIFAAGNGHKIGELVRYLLAHGASAKEAAADVAGPPVKNGNIAIGRFTALHEAAELNADATEALLEAGADVHAKDIRGATPLAFAVATDHPILPAIKALLDHGALPSEGMEWARRYNNPKVLALLGATPAPTVDESPAARDTNKQTVRAAISRALAVTQPTAANFLPTGGCVSCHAQVWTGISVMATTSSSVQADYKAEADQAHTSAGFCNSAYQSIAQLEDPGGAADSASMLLMHMASSKAEPSLGSDALVHFIFSYQRRDGCWPEGAYPRPPMQDGDASITIRAIRALRAYPIPALKPEIDERVDRACRWLAAYRPQTVVDQAEQILGLAWAGKPVSSKWVKALKARQRTNGGWGQTDGQPTDAFATGEALMALRSAGVSAADAGYIKGVEYLLATQQPEGVWHVKTRSFGFQPYFQSGFPYDHDQWISQTGTAFAVLALNEAAK